MTRGPVGTSSGMCRVLYVQYTNPAVFPPTENGVRLFAEAGAEVVLMGTGADEPLQMEPREGVRMMLMPAPGSGWRQKLHYLRYTLWVIRYARRSPPSWVYAVDPLSCPVALLAALLSGARLVYHEYDRPSQGARRSLFLRVVMRLRRLTAHRAELCVVPNESRADAFRRETGRADVLSVWNCPRRGEVGPARLERGAGRLRVLYQGSLVPARVPTTLVDALALTPPGVSLVLVGFSTIGHPKHVETLAALARARGVGDRLVCVGALPTRSAVLDQSAGCDVGLSLMPLGSTDFNERTMAGASNKPFDYMAAGLPVLVSDLPDWRAFYVEPGFARACHPDSAESIARELRWFLEHPEERLAMGARGRQRILDDWNFDRAFEPVLAHVLGGVLDRGAVESESPDAHVRAGSPDLV